MHYMVYQFNQLRISVPVVGHCVKNLVYAKYVFQCHLLIMVFRHKQYCSLFMGRFSNFVSVANIVS